MTAREKIKAASNQIAALNRFIARLERQGGQSELYVILNKVCAHLGVNKEALAGKFQGRELSDARHIYFYIAKKNTSKTLVDIGEVLNRNHATVIHAIKKVNNIPELLNIANEIENLYF